MSTWFAVLDWIILISSEKKTVCLRCIVRIFTKGSRKFVDNFFLPCLNTEEIFLMHFFFVLLLIFCYLFHSTKYHHGGMERSSVYICSSTNINTPLCYKFVFKILIQVIKKKRRKATIKFLTRPKQTQRKYNDLVRDDVDYTDVNIHCGKKIMINIIHIHM